MINVNNQMLDNLVEDARKSPRRRKNLNFHTEASDLLQRMMHAMEPDTYVQPHRHLNPDKREVFIIFRGRVAAVEYTDEGEVINWFLLDAGLGNHAVEMTPKLWHNLIALDSGTVIYEIKDGPYDPADDKYFAGWAPAEGDAGGMEFNEKILKYLGLK